MGYSWAPPLGAKILQAPRRDAQQVGTIGPNKIVYADGWLRTESGIPLDGPPWNSDVWFHLDHDAGWLDSAAYEPCRPRRIRQAGRALTEANRVRYSRNATQCFAEYRALSGRGNQTNPAIMPAVSPGSTVGATTAGGRGRRRSCGGEVTSISDAFLAAEFGRAGRTIGLEPGLTQNLLGSGILMRGRGGEGAHSQTLRYLAELA